MLVSDLGHELSDVFAQARRKGAVAGVRRATDRGGAQADSGADSGLLVSLGARTPEQVPLRTTNDLSFHRIPRSVPSSAISFDHPSPIRYWADSDLNVAFPRDRLAELETAGTIGALAPTAISVLGSITLWDRLATETAPRIKGSQVVVADAVAHGKPASLAGQEKEFTIRCTC
jgi:hypothetical protein